MNSGKREDILGRIREALRVPAPRLHAGHGAAPAPFRPGATAGLASGGASRPRGSTCPVPKNCVQLKTDLQLVVWR